MPLFDFQGRPTPTEVQNIIAGQVSLREQYWERFKEKLGLESNPIPCFICKNYSHQVWVLCQCRKCQKAVVLHIASPP